MDILVIAESKVSAEKMINGLQEELIYDGELICIGMNDNISNKDLKNVYKIMIKGSIPVKYLYKFQNKCKNVLIQNVSVIF